MDLIGIALEYGFLLPARVLHRLLTARGATTRQT